MVIFLEFVTNEFSSSKMFPCLPYTVSTPFMAPDSIKENEDTINKINQELLKRAKETGNDTPFKIVKISKNKLATILRQDSTQHKSRLDNSVSNLGVKNSNLKKDWEELPQQVKDEVLKLTFQKQIRKCLKNCPCQYTQELIHLYHNAQLLRKKIEKIEANIGNQEPQVSRSDVDFFEDDSTCKSLIKEIKTQKTDMKKLKNIYEKIKDKLKHHSEKSFRVEKRLKEVNKKMLELNKVVREFEPEEKIHHLKEEQQTIEIGLLNHALSFEENEILKIKEDIELRLGRKEEWKKQEKIWDEKRCKQRQTDTLLVLKSTNLMENYIQELKSKIKFVGY